MCFSSTASFAAAAVLAAAGAVSLRKVQEPKQLIFASIPLLFSIQQLSEGFLWLALTNPVYAGMEKSSTLIFLVFAQILWPFHVPLAVFLLEKTGWRKRNAAASEAKTAKTACMSLMQNRTLKGL